MAGSQVVSSSDNVSVVTRWFGVRSEVWAWRQLRAFTKLQPSVISWTYDNQDEFPLEGRRIDLVGTKQEPNDGRGRWWWRLRNLPSGNFFGTHGAEKRRLVSILQSQRPRVILSHFGFNALRMLPAASALGIPVVPHFHGLDISSGLEHRWYRWSLKNHLNKFPAIVCVGTEQKARLLDLGADADRVYIISCGVPTKDFPLVQRPVRDPITFVTVSRLVEWKGTHHSIGAFARVLKQHPEAKLVVVGEGPEEQRLRDMVSRDSRLAEAVRFAGSQSESQVRELLNNADVFLQHSLHHSSGWFEGFGVSVTEAASTGLPVVVSACGGLTDQVVDGVTGFIVPERDEAAMAEAMLKLALDPELRSKLGMAGHKHAAEHYDVPLQASKLEQVLLDVAS